MKNIFYTLAIKMLLLCFITNETKAQDIHFSQFFNAPLLRNPSLAGLYNGDIRIQSVYRDQWNSVTDAYRTGSLDAEYKMPIGQSDDFLTLGLQMLYDKAGTVAWTSTHLLPAINYHKSLSSDYNRYLSLGFMGGMVQRSIDRSKMTTNSMYNGQGLGETFTANQYTFFDASVGMSYNSQLNDPNDNMFIGLAYHHFTRPKNSFYRDAGVELGPKWVASAGLNFQLNDFSTLTIQADYSRQGTYQETVAGFLYGLKLGDDPENPLYVIHAGGFMRLNDSFIPVLKLEYNPFAITFSYDANISQLRTSSYGRGGFEIGISYMGFMDRMNSSLNTTLCPRF